ncbi:MAG: alpha-galactosidase [Clostridia bacterium]|nr:alpha-galactosidase [Clostridia bacterium]
MKKGLAVLSGLTAAVGGGILYLKNKDICPKCEIKKLLAKTQIHYTKDEMYNNGAALTPPMGWSSWNIFRHNINENVILDVAKAVKESGLADAGYVYINLDDCWQSSMRDENGRMQGDFSTFPHGIKWLVEQINELGLKVGIYSSNGTLTCEDLPASLYNEQIDAETFAEWGIEYFKYDYCHHVLIPTDAPYIDSISIVGNGIENELIFKAKDATLKGDAKVVNEEDGKTYVKGLCSSLGTIEFNNIDVPEDGEYIFTLIMRKNTCKGQFCVVTVNGADKYDFLISEQKAFSREGRRQIKINLKAGINTISIANPVASPMDSAAMQYEKMGRELVKATKKYAEENNCEEKKILYSICEWGWNKPWKWGGKAGNIWRTTPDIQPIWSSVLGIYEVNVKLDKYACPGAFNDPDMLEVGNGKLTYEENKSHFTLWSMMAAPLILGNDIRAFIKEDGTVDKDNKVLQILTNKEVIAVNQDKLGIQCKRIKAGLKDILVKPLENNEVAVCFFNKTNSNTLMSCDMADIHNVVEVSLPNAESYTCKELWYKTEEIITDKISTTVAPHGVKIFKISANQ